MSAENSNPKKSNDSFSLRLASAIIMESMKASLKRFIESSFGFRRVKINKPFIDEFLGHF